MTAESRNFALGTSSLVTTGTFTLVLGSAGTTFLRPEDGAWDPVHPDDYYFVTTDQLNTLADGIGTQVGHSRLWKLHFSDLSNPTAGGTIEAVLDGTEGKTCSTISPPTPRACAGWTRTRKCSPQRQGLDDISSDSLIQVVKHDPARFGDTSSGNRSFTVDEESSYPRRLGDLTRPTRSMQAHYPNGPVLVEGGQSC